MPTYEYRCKHCSHTMEEFQSMKDDPLVMCPKCKTPNLVRIIGSGSGLIFKGQGFYLTDYKKGSSQASTSSASSSSSVSKSNNDATPKSDRPAPSSPASESKSAAESSDKKQSGQSASGSSTSTNGSSSASK
ncbi:MAG TPA: zinc ribbon domain-containing protein [Bacteroidota bacterium]|nr:zinc ribbon domain-containing protein [Bacteroidota bacterium]